MPGISELEHLSAGKLGSAQTFKEGVTMGLARPLAVAGALILSIAPSAIAADHRVPLGNTDFSIPAEDCGFPIDVSVVADKEYIVKTRDNADGSSTLRVTGRL